MDVVNFNVELTDLATTFNLNKICRLCMGKDMNLLPLFGHDDSLSEKIMNLSPRLKLYSDDGLPSQICSLCVNQVNTSYNFKLQCETSDITLRRLLDFQVQSENCETFTIKEESDVSTTVKVGNTNLDDRSNQECQNNPKAQHLPKPTVDNRRNLTVSKNEETSLQGVEKFSKTEKLTKEDNSLNSDIFESKKQNKSISSSKCKENSVTVGDHIQSCYMQTDIYDKGCSCQFCGKKFISKYSLHTHYKVFHPGETPFTCDKCGESFVKHVALKKHKRTHSEKYVCDICGQQFNIQRSLKHHLVVHSGEKPFSCHVCGKTFAHRDNLNIHLVLHSDEKPFSCEECGMCFKQRKTLSYHMKTHTGEQNFACVHCGKRFSRKKGLQSHMFCHTGEKPIDCPECDQSFARKESLVKHMRIHTGHKPFVCLTCGKAFTASGQLKYHAATHEKIKPFMCTECGKTFARKDRLNDHLSSHSGKRPFSCPFCGKGFVRKDHLKSHLNSTHDPDEMKS